MVSCAIMAISEETCDIWTSRSSVRDMHLERIIAEMVERKDAASEGSAQHRFAIRQLIGLRDHRELAGGIIEDMDPEWILYL